MAPPSLQTQFCTGHKPLCFELCTFCCPDGNGQSSVPRLSIIYPIGSSVNREHSVGKKHLFSETSPVNVFEQVTVEDTEDDTVVDTVKDTCIV